MILAQCSVLHRRSPDQSHRGVAAVERCNQPDVGNTQGGMNKEAAGSVGGEGSPWELPHIAELIDRLPPAPRLVLLLSDRTHGFVEFVGSAALIPATICHT